MSLYTELKAAGVPLDHHESDLYAKDCTKAREIMKANGIKTTGAFCSQVDGYMWLEFPFMYEPFWDAKP